MNLPNQERCCEKCEEYSNDWHALTTCPCHTQNHSTKDYQDLTDEEKKEMMLDLARKANKSQRDMVHSTMEGWEEEFDGLPDYVIRGAMHTRQLSEIKRFIRTLLAKERESAERRGQEKAYDEFQALMQVHTDRIGMYCDTGEDMDWGCRSECVALGLKRIKDEAARKDTDV